MSTSNKIILVVTAILFVLIVGFGIKAALQSSNQSVSVAPSTASSTLPGLQTGNAPWIAEIDHLKERLADIGLPALAEEGTVLHIHQHLDIFIHGKSVPVAAGIGINELAGFISPIHVHDDTGIIHVESPTIQTYTLGQFFDIWGVAFSANSIGGYTNDASSTLQVYVNGSKFNGDPRTLALAAHQEIVITYGTAEEQPVIPSSFDFPAGY